MKNYADRELCQKIYDRKLILDAKVWFIKPIYCKEPMIEELHKDTIEIIKDRIKITPAYNCVELLDALPQSIEYVNAVFELLIKTGKAKDGKKYWHPQYRCFTSTLLEDTPRVYEEEICNALAKMILCLDDKGLLKE